MRLFGVSQQQGNHEPLGMSKIGWLQAQELFSDFSAEELEWLDQATTLVEAKKGEILFHPACPGEQLFIIKKGQVRICGLHCDGRRLIKSVLGGGAIFGQMAMLGQDMGGSVAECVQDSILCTMTQEQVERVLLAKPRVALRLISALGRRLRETEALLEDLAFRDVPSRLASLLVRLSAERGPHIRGIAHQEIAERINAARPTVTGFLNAFRHRGLIDLGWRRIMIVDQEGLAAVADGARPIQCRDAEGDSL